MSISRRRSVSPYLATRDTLAVRGGAFDNVPSFSAHSEGTTFRAFEIPCAAMRSKLGALLIHPGTEQSREYSREG